MTTSTNLPTKHGAARTEPPPEEFLAAMREELLLTAALWNKTLEDEDLGYWKGLLEPYPIAAIKYAFDNWRRNGHKFPYPAVILQLLASWKETQPRVEFHSCGKDGCIEGWVPIGELSSAVKRCSCWTAFQRGDALPAPVQKGSGYGTNDLRMFCTLFVEMRYNLGRPLVSSDVELLIAELDRRTGRTKPSVQAPSPL